MNIDWNLMKLAAEKAQTNALLAPGGKTKVGCAAMNEHGTIAAGCNIQHKYRCDIHAEVAALSSLRSQSEGKLVAILVLAERDKFTPCGSCMDWIFELGGPRVRVGFQNSKGMSQYWAEELMPHYPA